MVYTGPDDALYKVCTSPPSGSPAVTCKSEARRLTGFCQGSYEANGGDARVNELIAEGISLRYQDSWNDKETALMKTTTWGHTAAAKAIVAADPDPVHIRMTNVR